MFLETLKNENIKAIIKEIIHTVAEILYNEIYIYICVICLYSISSFIILLAILYSCFSMYVKTKENIYNTHIQNS